MEFSLLYLLWIFSPVLASFLHDFELSSSLLLPRSNPTSRDGNCGSNSETNATCLTSTFGNCCSSKGFCGKTSAYCAEGCQDAFGTCSSMPDGQLVSTSGSCGATSTSNITCQGSTYGDCCSSLGYCGKNVTYCGDGCQSEFGTCSSVDDDETSTTTATTDKTSTSTAASATSLGAISIDGNCGSNSDIDAICKGSEFGDCCSSLGYCGGNSSYCGTGCQSEFGSCDTTTSSTTSSATSSTASSANSSTDSSTGSLSTGAKAGIAVGSVIGGLGAIGLLAWLLIRRRKNNKKPSLPKMDEAAGIRDNEARYEMPEQSLVELPADYARVQEMKRVDDRVAAGYDGAYRGH
ncbi:hypothetical protein MRS44_012133 [Fusarium solani]|uniref:uncharacterized protein n=1 Tax=Fusarium solani TaxID=169388 RepID=UPI0032C45168|nr:hypothetical protein MRS44_012133 [Fusarium solani]